ncbi:uncharacterized protein BX664DRAFT_314272 [Halteromyces radiatus]|uniref:uncharacterized protein n=1 Tax=Halteromyces radiatus TaxID=101107 RepID=UPI00221EBD56|nr:uncharacterized protein BX664DRAFT_314272 [Halteromyces radiatus]KAI8089028.1 hypothetical protein BX664DRAFT_314272 [Halteromyces radiatus]
MFISNKSVLIYFCVMMVMMTMVVHALPLNLSKLLGGSKDQADVSNDKPFPSPEKNHPIIESTQDGNNVSNVIDDASLRKDIRLVALKLKDFLDAIQRHDDIIDDVREPVHHVVDLLQKLQKQSNLTQWSDNKVIPDLINTIQVIGDAAIEQDDDAKIQRLVDDLTQSVYTLAAHLDPHTYKNNTMDPTTSSSSSSSSSSSVPTTMDTNNNDVVGTDPATSVPTTTDTNNNDVVGTEPDLTSLDQAVEDTQAP